MFQVWEGMWGASFNPQGLCKNKSSCWDRHSSPGAGHTRNALLTKTGLSASHAACVLEFMGHVGCWLHVRLISEVFESLSRYY